MTQATSSSNSYKKYHIEQLKGMIYARLDPVAFLEHFGVDVQKENDFELRCGCPIHGGDNQQAFRVELWDGEAPTFRWTCYTGCGGDFGDIFDFVMKMQDLPFPHAVSWVAKFTGIEVDEHSSNQEDFVDFREVARIRRLMNDVYSKKKTPAYISPFINSGFVTQCMHKRNNYFRDRGYEDSILDHFGVGFCPAHISPWTQTKNKARVTIPLLNHKGVIVGVSGRSITETDNAGDKYIILPGSNKSEILYGLNFAIPFIKEKGHVILVEGFSDVWRCWQHGYRNVVAVCGKDITPYQKKLLMYFSRRVIIAFDTDPAGIEGGDTVQDQLIDVMTVKRMFPPEGMDIGDLEKEVFKKCLKNSRKQFEKVNKDDIV